MSKIINVLFGKAKPTIWLISGLLIGITGALSYLRTDWPTYHPDLFLWWSIVSTIISFILACISIWQSAQVNIQEEKIKAQVKVWMNDASGIASALKNITMAKYASDKFTNISDVYHSINAVQESVSALYQSLYEERCVSEVEYKERQKNKSDLLARIDIAKIENELVEIEAKKVAKPA